MVKKIRLWVELSCDSVVDVPSWVKTEEDLEQFADEYIGNNITSGYELMDEQMDYDDFEEEIQSQYQEAKDSGRNDFVIAIDTDLDYTYRIACDRNGFFCEAIRRHSDVLRILVSELYDELHGNVISIKIE